MFRRVIDDLEEKEVSYSRAKTKLSARNSEILRCALDDGGFGRVVEEKAYFRLYF